MSPSEEKSYVPLVSDEELDALIQGYNSRGSVESEDGGRVFRWVLGALVTLGAGLWWWS